MKVYFVRHGESLANVERNPWQEDHDPLTNEGIRQAEIVAERFSRIDIDYIISGNNLRAKRTAEIIQAETGIPIDFSDLFVERKIPSVLKGRKMDDEMVHEVRRQEHANFHAEEWRYSDEENFLDLKKRGLAALDFLTSLPNENVLVITHGLFLRMLVSCMILGKELTSREYYKIMVALETRNTGITMCEYKPGEPHMRANPWHIVAWNDHAHLG